MWRFCDAPTRQGGAATLFVVLVLLIALTLIMFAMSRVGFQEQTISGNHQRAHKAMDAAQAGLEYGFDWLSQNFVAADNEYLADGTTCACWPKVLDPTTDPSLTITPGTGETYNVSVTITPKGSTNYSPYSACSCTTCPIPSDPTNPCLDPVASPYLQVTSTATDANDSSVTATAQQLGVQTDKGTLMATLAPPFIMNGCFQTNTVGTSEIYPAVSGDSGPLGDAILAVGSANTSTATETGNPQDNECYDEQHAAGRTDAQIVSEKCDPKGMCDCPCLNNATDDRSLIDVHGGDVEDSLNKTVWETLFPDLVTEFGSIAKSKAWVRAQAKGEVAAGIPASKRHYVWIDNEADANELGSLNSITSWKTNLGSGTLDHATPYNPCGISPPKWENLVILVFSPSAGCPKLQGGVEIWGTVYIDAMDNPSLDCSASGEGWGGGQVMGTVGIESSVWWLTSNPVICGLDVDDPGGPIADQNYVETLVRVPGTASEF